jgi:TolB protein
MGEPDQTSRSIRFKRSLRLAVVGLAFALIFLAGFYAYQTATALGILFSPTFTQTETAAASTSTPTETPQPASTTSAPGEAATFIPTPSPAFLADASNSGTAYLAYYEGVHSHIFAFPLEQRPITRLTSGEWDDITPALHPDGRSLAFASNRDGYWDLYLLNFESGEISRLTNTPEYDASPSWSPDGLWVAYESYVSDESGGNLEIFIRPMDGSQPPIRLTNDPAADHSPSWSPQGRKIAFVSTRGGNADIWIADLDQVDQRYQNVSRSQDAADAHPVWSPDGNKLVWSSAPLNGVQTLRMWDATAPEARPAWLSSGDWAAWSPDGSALLVSLREPNHNYLTGYQLEQQRLILPLMDLSGDVTGLTWGRNAPFLERLTHAFGERQTPTPLWTPAFESSSDLPSGRVGVVTLDGVEAPNAMLQDGVDESFYALRNAVAQIAGWDFLASLEQAFLPLTSPLNPGMVEDWLYTGRAFRFNTAPASAGWLILAREDFGALTYWRVYLRARFQDGRQGLPLKDLPWDLTARHSGDPIAYEQGGKLVATPPPGYWVDFTRLASAYGWERLPALSSWRVAFSSIRYNEFALKDGRDWLSAMLEIYPKAALDTPTPVSSPTMTATPTQTPTPTPTFTRPPYRSPTPTLTSTRRPTLTPTPPGAP